MYPYVSKNVLTRLAELAATKILPINEPILFSEKSVYLFIYKGVAEGILVWRVI